MDNLPSNNSSEGFNHSNQTRTPSKNRANFAIGSSRSNMPFIRVEPQELNDSKKEWRGSYTSKSVDNIYEKIEEERNIEKSLARLRTAQNKLSNPSESEGSEDNSSSLDTTGSSSPSNGWLNASRPTRSSAISNAISINCNNNNIGNLQHALKSSSATSHKIDHQTTSSSKGVLYSSRSAPSSPLKPLGADFILTASTTSSHPQLFPAKSSSSKHSKKKSTELPSWEDDDSPLRRGKETRSLVKSSDSVGSESKKSKNKPKWMADHERVDCTLCNCIFSTFNRKHHCRSCGLLVCGKCSQNHMNLETYGYKGMERVCDRCYTMHLNKGNGGSISLRSSAVDGPLSKSPSMDGLLIREGEEEEEESFESYGLAHTFESKYFTSPTFCNFCEMLILELGFYQCKVCNYSAHKKCCPLVPNTCSPKTKHNNESSIKLDRKTVEKLHQTWSNCNFDSNRVNSSDFLKFFHDCVIRVIDDPSETLLGKIVDNSVFRIFRFIDRDNSGYISFEEYALFISTLQHPEPEDQIRFHFCLYDSNGDGQLSLEELQQGFRQAPSHSLFGGGDLLADVLAEGVFHSAGVPMTKDLTFSQVMDAYHRDPSLLIKFCGG